MITICTPMGADWRLWFENIAPYLVPGEIRAVAGIEAQGRGYGVGARKLFDPVEVADAIVGLGAPAGMCVDAVQVVEDDWGGRGMPGEQRCRDLMMAAALEGSAPGDVVLWFDCDERPVNLPAIAERLKLKYAGKAGPWRPLLASWVTIWKRLPGGGGAWMLRSGLPGGARVQVMSGVVVGAEGSPPTFRYSRNIEATVPPVDMGLVLLHDSWDCGGDGPRAKFHDWSHRSECSDAAIDAFCRSWEDAGPGGATVPVYPIPKLSNVFGGVEHWSADRLARVARGDVMTRDLI